MTSLGKVRLDAGHLVVAAVVAMLVAGCDGGGASQSDETASTPKPPTDQNTTLAIGKAATIPWAPGKGHRSTLRLRVTGVRQGRARDLRELDPSRSVRSARIYYVSVRVANLGKGDLSGQRVELFGRVSKRLVVPPVQFGPAAVYPRCEYRLLPKKFVHDATARLCLVLLAPHHGKISAVEWRGSGASAEAKPVSWAVR